MSKIKNKDLSSAKYHNKPIRVRCIISGKSIAPYCIPRKIRINCTPKEEEMCKECKYRKDRNKEIDVEAIDERILMFVDVPTYRLNKIIAYIYKIPCDFSYEVIDMQNIERIFVLPPTGKDRGKIKLAHISYYIGHGLDINTLYMMDGYTSVDPTNQTTTHIFTSADKIKSDIETFKLSRQKHEELRQFCVQDPTVASVYAHLEELYTYYAHNITKIYGRFDLHLAVDLVFKSVLSFRFDNEFVHKGWIDAMVIGDTRCGKGYVAEKLIGYFGLGEVISGENCSFAGLVGGLQQYNGHWVVTWGKVPLNDGGMVTIDEASEIPTQDWTKLSRIRSEGVAEITKIQTQVTNARTRLLFLSNPPLKMISNYSYGVQSVMDVVKAPEDVARFDYVLVVAHNEVSIRDINRHREVVDNFYNSDLEQDLILWIWSRKTDEVVFSDEAVRLTYKLSVRLAKEYSFSVPLIQGENIRIKLAKIAVGFAGRLYSNKQNGKILYVDSIHVECANHFLNLIYKKNASGYHDMSRMYKIADAEAMARDFSQIEKYLNAFTKHKDEICKCLMTNNNVQVNDISEHVNLDREIAREIISKLLKHNCIIKKYQYYIKTPAFTSWLKGLVLNKDSKER